MYKNKFILISTLFILSILIVSCGSNIEKNEIVVNNTKEPTEAIEKPSAATEAAEPTPSDSPNAPEINSGKYEIVTLLPFDAIRAIDDPTFLSAKTADSEYSPSELVIGVSINGESKAYSINLLSRHEIVNDTVGGAKISVTW